ncbi:MAG: hypothetical protein HUK07_07385, partial [Bacteroidaceae bacterium]|nr:hypothetical protein [Bacteroidaceae bacterium]
MKKFLYILLLLTLAVSVSASDNIVYQKFFNLGKRELQIDSLLPEFVDVINLPENFKDSVYTVKLVYPEFTELSKNEREKCKEILASQPQNEGKAVEFIPRQSGYSLVNGITLQTVVDRKKGKLEVFFVPIVTDGKSYKALSSFMLRV